MRPVLIARPVALTRAARYSELVKLLRPTLPSCSVTDPGGSYAVRRALYNPARSESHQSSVDEVLKNVEAPLKLRLHLASVRGSGSNRRAAA